jgi:hypothetical protein
MVLNNFDSVATYLPNRDLDPGAKVKPGGYKLTDKTSALKQGIFDFYADPAPPSKQSKILRNGRKC